MTDLLDTLPYARFLGLQSRMTGDDLVVVMPFADHLVGNPMLPALHGGSTAALLEMTAVAQVALRYPRRVAHVLAEAWQGDETQPIATLTAHFLLDEENNL